MVLEPKFLYLLYRNPEYFHVTAILVSGLINIEVTARVDGFPVEYAPVRYPFFGVNSSISGVGYNIAKALTVLGDSIRLCSLTGRDRARLMVADALHEDGIDNRYVLETLDQTPHSVILYETTGRRAINVDLKDIQEQRYPTEVYETAIDGCDLAVLCNINFSRSLLQITKDKGIPIVTDVHSIGEIEDAYNTLFMTMADVVFQSHEKLPCSPEEWVRRMFQRYGTEIVVVGMGAEGVTLGVKRDNFVELVPAVYTRPVVNTIGAGDALLSAFVHCYARDHDPYAAIKKAQFFASYKIGASGGAADGFLDEVGLEGLIGEIGM